MWYNKTMDDNKILELTSKIETTLGKENFAMISDTVGELLTGNTMNMQSLAERDAEIKELKSRNEKLVSANGALLQRVPQAVEKPVEKSQEEKAEKPISWNDIFDKKGNFIH